jgi:hypothetical protein
MRYDGSWADPGDCQGNDDLTLLILGTVLLAFAVAVSPAEQSVAQAVGSLTQAPLRAGGFLWPMAG